MRSFFVAIGLLIVGSAGVIYWKKSPSNPVATNRKSGSPTTAVVATRDINFAVTAAGDIGPLDAVSVRPEIGGLISKLTLDIGDKVRKGDVLFELDDKDLQTEKSSRKTEIAGARLAVETQKLQLEKAKLNFDRVKGLFESKLVAQEVFDNARIDHDLTKNSLDIAMNRLETAQTALQQVEDKLLKTVIRAPFDCTILTRPVSVGQAVSGSSGFNSGTEVFTVANLADMIITAHINQADVTRLKVGQEVTVEVEAVAGLKLVGRVDRIAPQATFRNGVKGFSTRIILKNAEDAVRPGMTANLSIPLISVGNVLAIPLASVFNDQGERFVYVQKGDDRFERQPVQLGVADFDFAEVTKGLKGGEVISLIAPPSEANAGQTAGVKSGAAATAK
jgi:HlyD family secretion protein